MRHVLPNLVPVITVTVVLGIGNIMLIESGLAYLGISVPVPSPSLGRMINDGTTHLTNAPWLAVVPGVAIGLAVTAFGLLGDQLQRAMDPRSQ